MSHSECFRALGVAPNASWEEVRQAYKDLVRVWHPDRFQSDPNLRARAEQQLQKVNQAYHTLKNAQIFTGSSTDAAPEPPPPQPPRPAPVVQPDPPAPRLSFRWPVKTIAICSMCVTPLVCGAMLLNALRVPTIESVLQQNSAPRLEILSPSRMINPLGDKWAALRALSAWTRGDTGELWRPLSKLPEPAAAPREPRRLREIAPAEPVMPVNGTELLWTRQSGAGELCVTNTTGHDAFATLVQAHTTVPQRAIYIQSKNKGCMRNLAPGLYQLAADVGEDWDPVHVRFRAERHALDRSGTFECMDVTSTQGMTGCQYNIALKSQ